jgi:predicted transcriptional regulator
MDADDRHVVRAFSSPPTERVVAIVEMLVGTGSPMSVSEVTEYLGLTRSTCAAILDTLEHFQWASDWPIGPINPARASSPSPTLCAGGFRS